MANNDIIEGKPFQMPDELTVVAIGGCGKKLITNLYDHEWFLKHYLSDGKRLTLYTLDTDSNQRKDDLRRSENVEARVGELQRTNSQMGGSVKSYHYHLPDLANVERVSSLTSKDICEQIKKRRERPLVDVWWMNDPEYGFDYQMLKKVDKNIVDDFGGGVHRRRAISKAVFYKAITQGGEQFPSFQGHGPVAIIVGLGGGTGSGMFIDLARYIKEKRGQESKIWLFVVLPAASEGDKEQLNAAIALSEIEYLNMKDDKLFNYIIVSSLSPTGYVDGGDRKQEVVEFDSSFPYMFINSFYLPTADISAIVDAKKDYSGFIFADSHVIEYPVENLRSLKKGFEDVIDSLAGVGQNRAKIIKDATDFVSVNENIYPDEFSKTDSEITHDDVNLYRKEIEKVKKVWENEITDLLNFKTQSIIESAVSNNMPEELKDISTIKEYDKLTEYVARLKKSLENESKPHENAKDQELYEIIKKNLRLLEEMAALQKKALRVTEKSARSALINLIRGEENFGKFSGELSMKESSLKAEISESEAKVKKKRTELEEVSKESSSMLDRIRTEVNALAKPVDDYVALGHGKGASAGQESIEDLERAFQDKFSALLFVLKEKLNQAEKNKAKPIKRDLWLSSLPLGDLQGDIERLENATAADFTYLKDLAESVSLYYYNDYMLRIAKKQGFTDSLLGKKLNSEMFRSEKATKEERIRKISQMHPGKISIRDPFEVFIQDKFLTREFDSKLGSLREATLGPLVSLFNLESEEKAYLVKSFSGRDTAAILTSVRDSLTEIINSREGFSSKTESINNEIDNLIQSQKRMQQQIEFLQKTDNLISNSFDARKKFNAEANAYESGLRTIDEKRKSGNSTVEGMYRTWFGEINPNVLSLLNDDSDLSVLDYDEEGKKEIEKLYNIVQWKYKELVDAHKLGINNLSVGYGSAGTERWSFDKSALVASSPSRWLSQLIDNKGSDFRRYLVKLLDLKGFDSAKVNSHNYTKPWEISLTFFAAASFLDNISPLTTGGGYWEKYEKGRDNILHHALYLHEGKYVVRDRTLLLTDAAEIADLESGDKAQIEEAKRRVMELYTVKDIKEAVGE
ncbi:MAG: tubulin-like doman-containing protein [Methanomicrobium sp.]|nr:tubulin-like doman-containing protein [Methanomicrobium sp.]